MELLAALKFVQGAVARKSYDVSLSHFAIENGMIRGYNGLICLTSPVPVDITAYPKAAPFIKAIERCDSVVSLHMTPAGKLAVRSGSFRAYIDCLESRPDVFPPLIPTGVKVEVNGNFLPAVKKILPFVGQDASRPWCRGILFRGQSLFATNNVVLIEHWLPFLFPVEVNVPEEALEELVRCGEQPSSLWVDENALTFGYADGRLLRTRVYATGWPNLAAVLSDPKDGADQYPFPENFFEVLRTLKPFANKLNRVYIRNGFISTSLEDGEGAAVDIATTTESSYNSEMLLLLEGVADTIDFTLYPKPAIFYGLELRGAITGMRT